MVNNSEAYVYTCVYSQEGPHAQIKVPPPLPSPKQQNIDWTSQYVAIAL